MCSNGSNNQIKNLTPNQAFLVLLVVISNRMHYFQTQHTSQVLLSSVPSTNAICDQSMRESHFFVD